jgi:acetolactate synthase-1/2/3 large subunit
VLALPEDMLSSETDAPDAPRFHVVQPSPARADLDALRDLLAAAERPFVIVGGGGWTGRASASLQEFVEGNNLPAGAAFRRQDALDNDSPSYAGDVGIGINPALAERVRSADLVLSER